VFARNGLDPARLTWEQIPSIPITRKADVRDHGAHFVADDAVPRYRSFTGGTTGGRPLGMWWSEYLVPAEDLPSANALNSMSFQLGRVVGPSLGGLLLSAGGITAALVVNGLSFAVPAILVLPVLSSEKWVPPETTPGRTWRTDLRDGAATLWGHPVLRELLRSGTPAAALLVGPFLVSLPFLVADRFDDPRALGFLLAFFPIGFVAGSLWAGRLARLDHRGVRMFGGIAVAALMLALFGLRLPLPVLALAALVNGFALEISGLAQTSAFQELVPEARLGRVAALQQVIDFGLTPVSFAAASLLTDRFGAGTALLAGGVLAASVATAAVFRRDVRSFD
jgi:predicted MFS family arabinose efflux permease